MSSGLKTQRSSWFNPFGSSVAGSMTNVFTRLDYQQRFTRNNFTDSLPSNTGAPMPQFDSNSDFHMDHVLSPFQHQITIDGLYTPRGSMFPQTYEHMISSKNLGQSSLSSTMNGRGTLTRNGELIHIAKSTPQEMMDAKALAASKSHSEAEKRRRERINNHMETLRSLLPNTTKTDKASLLADVIQHVKELKQQAAEIAEWGSVPSDVDEVLVETDSSSIKDRVLIKASLCCEDRPGLLADLIRTLRNLKLQTLKAEFSTLGGRVKNVILLTNKDTISEEQDGHNLASIVQEAIRAVLERSPVSSELSPPSVFLGSNKRQIRRDFTLF